MTDVRGFTPFAAVFFTAVMLSCGGHHPKPDNFPSDAENVLATLASQGQGFRSVRAELRLELWRDGDRVRMSEFLALDDQGRLRFDLLTPFGQPLTTVVSDGEQLSVYELETKRFRVGEATAENLASLVPVDLSPSELVAVLRGRPPQIRHDEAQLSWNAQRGWYRLELTKGRDRQLIELAPANFVVMRIRHWRDQALRYDARFADYHGEQNIQFPIRMRFEFPPSKSRVDIEMVSHEINPVLPPETFQLVPPRGIKAELF